MSSGKLSSHMQFVLSRAGSTTSCSVTFPIQTCWADCVAGYTLNVVRVCYLLAVPNTECGATTGVEPILTKPECKVALQALGIQKLSGLGAWSAGNFPKGCVLKKSIGGFFDGVTKEVKFNAHASGAAHADAIQVCKKFCPQRGKIRHVESTRCEWHGDALEWAQTGVCARNTCATNSLQGWVSNPKTSYPYYTSPGLALGKDITNPQKEQRACT